MKRFMIGQFGKYDKRKQDRDFRNNFFGVEACLFEGKEDIESLINIVKKEKISFGVHFPLRANKWKLRDPQYLSLDNDISIDSHDYMIKEFQYLKSLKPHYVLIHYPKPVILDDNVNWANWRFADDTEYYYESEYSYEVFREKSKAFFKWLSEQGKEHEFIPVLELDAINKYIYDTSLLQQLLDEFNNIKLCLDIGRLHLQEMIDENFDSFEFFAKYSRYAEVIHLWDVKVKDGVENSHYPVLPKNLRSEGWADVDMYMKILRDENKECKILFEHRSDLISDEELEECYRWIDELLAC